MKTKYRIYEASQVATVLYVFYLYIHTLHMHAYEQWPMLIDIEIERKTEKNKTKEKKQNIYFSQIFLMRPFINIFRYHESKIE